MVRAPALDYRRHFEHRRAPDLDGARGVLSLCVVLFHFGANSFILRATHGALVGLDFRLCVDAFFILSGYVLTGSLSKSSPGALRFARKRFFRLAPMFYLTTAVALIFPVVDYAWSTAPLELIAGQTIIGRNAANGPSWSMTWEFYLPVLAVTAAPWMPKIERPVAIVLLLFALIALGLIDGDLVNEDGFYFERALLGLGAGHLLFQSRLRRLVAWRAWMTPTLLGAALLAMLAATVAPLAVLVFPFIVCAMILSGASKDGAILSSRPAQWLGAISYSLYMVHIPIMRIGEAIGGNQFAQNPLAKCLGIVVSLIVATALTRWIEVPLMDLGRQAKIEPSAINIR